MSDLISRQDAIDAMRNSFCGNTYEVDKAIEAVEALPSAKPYMDEWCTECKEYDKEKHCCPRWNKVIRKTVEEMQMVGKIAMVIEHDASITYTDGYKYLRTEYLCGNCKKRVIGGDEYCSHCGARLEWN